MHHSLLQLFIEVTFNLTLVDETVWDDTACALGESWRENIIELILSASLPARSSALFSRLYFESFNTSQTQIVEATEDAKMQVDRTSEKTTIPLPSPTLFKRMSTIVRGRELPFPAAPVSRRSILPTPPSNLNMDSILQQHYSSISSPALVGSGGIPSRGRTMQRIRPLLSRGDDSRTADSPKSIEEEPDPIQHMSRKTLRAPPFPLPHRPIQRSISNPPAQKDGGTHRVSKRMSSIPPSLVLRSSFSSEDEDSMIL